MLRVSTPLLAVCALALTACGGGRIAAGQGASSISSPVPPVERPAGGPSTSAEAKPTMRVGSTNFAEQAVLAELYSQGLESIGYKVERKFNLGTREVVFPALESGQIDLEPDYLATLLLFLDKNAKASSDPALTAQLLQQALVPRKLTLLEYTPAVNTNGFVVTEATSQKYNLRKLSDLQSVASQLVAGGAPECPQRPFCLRGLEDTYGLKFREFKPLDTGGPITVQALDAGQVQVAEMFTTDAQIQVHRFVLLEDDKHLQQADNPVPVIRNDALERGGTDLRSAITGFGPKLTTSELTSLNRAVSVDKREPKDVVREWLGSHARVSQ